MSFGLTILSLTYIIFIIVPGLIFKRFFYQNNPQKSSGVGNFADRIISSIFFGVLVQIVTVLIFTTGLNKLYGYDYLDYNRRLLNIHSELVTNSLPIISFKQLKFLFLELISSLMVGAVSGLVCFNFIRKFNLDVMFPVLRFDSDWKYIFRDEKRLFDHDTADKYRVFDSAQIDVLVKESSGDSFLYCGILNDYKVNKDGTLENISLLDTKRYTKKKDTSGVNIKQIPGHLVVIPYCNVLNMNITYFYRSKSSKNKYVESVVVIVLCILLFPIFVLPWFSSVAWYSKLFSILVLLFSWSNLAGFIMPFVSKSTNQINRNTQFVLLFFSILFLYAALYLLDIDLIMIMTNIINRR